MIYSLDKEVNRLMAYLESKRRPDYSTRCDSTSIMVGIVIEEEVRRQNEVAAKLLKEYFPSWVK